MLKNDNKGDANNKLVLINISRIIRIVNNLASASHQILLIVALESKFLQDIETLFFIAIMISNPNFLVYQQP